jgi:hypothetical protein
MKIVEEGDFLFLIGTDKELNKVLGIIKRIELTYHIKFDIWNKK